LFIRRRRESGEKPLRTRRCKGHLWSRTVTVDLIDGKTEPIRSQVNGTAFFN